jgi:RecJ-like exonuclease
MSERCDECKGTGLVSNGRALCDECGGAGEIRRLVSKRYLDALAARCTVTPWKGDDEDAVRYRAEEDRKAADDRAWVARRIERSGAYFE